MNPILLILIVVYLIIVLTMNDFSNAEITHSMNPIIAKAF